MKNDFVKIISEDPVPSELVNTFSSLNEYKFPVKLTHCIELENWTKNSKNKTHNIASMMDVITIASAVTAGKYFGETHAPTSLYTILVLPTGSGKNSVVQNPAKLIPDHVAVGNVTSLGALEDLIFDSPAITQIIDEYGDILGGMLSDKSSVKKEILTTQKSLYGSWDSVFQLRRYSSQGGRNEMKSRSVTNPAYGICGISTEEQLMNWLSEKMISDGFLNRFIIVNGTGIEPNFIDSPISTIPPSIIEHIERIKNIKSKILIPMQEDTKVYYTKIIGDADLPETDINIWVNGEELKREISVRWRENTLRLATALAAYEQFNTLPLWLLQWSYSFVKFNSVKFLQKFEDKDNQSVHTATIDVVKKWFKKQDEEWIPLHIIASNTTRLCAMKGKDRRDILNDMVERKILIEKKAGRTIFYSLV